MFVKSKINRSFSVAIFTNIVHLLQSSNKFPLVSLVAPIWKLHGTSSAVGAERERELFEKYFQKNISKRFTFVDLISQILQICFFRRQFPFFLTALFIKIRYFSCLHRFNFWHFKKRYCATQISARNDIFFMEESKGYEK